MTHDELVARAVKWLKNTERCQIVGAEISNGGIEIPDAMGWKTRGNSWLIECKTSRADFFRDRHKPGRRVGMSLGYYRYYMTPPKLVMPEELPEGWGLLEVHPKIVRRVVDATRQQNPMLDAWEKRVLLSLMERQGRELATGLCTRCQRKIAWGM